LNGGSRSILYLGKAEPALLKSLPRVRDRIAAVRAFRLESKRKSTIELASTPTLFQVNVIPDRPFLVIPEVSSERREYVPIGWMSPPTIPSNLVRVIEGASIPLFCLLTSSMHMSWLRHIGGRLKSDFRYSIGLVYNTFPMPPSGASDLERLKSLGEAVLNIRSAHPSATLSDLYDPDRMPADLHKAHKALDRAIDKLYRRAPFASDRERAEHLLSLYEEMVSPLQLMSGDSAAGRRRESKRRRD
jgi:hypothetical protein